jgi:hypothetical protein
MSRRNILILTIAAIFTFALSTFVMAGEKIKAHGTSVATKSEMMEVGDVEGHVIMISESKQVYFNEITGEKFTSTGHNLMEGNMKTGAGWWVKGYGVSTYPNGDKSFRSVEGKPVGQGHWKGTWKVTGGTGKYKGATGGGTWDTKAQKPGIGYNEVEGEIEYP